MCGDTMKTISQDDFIEIKIIEKGTKLDVIRVKRNAFRLMDSLKTKVNLTDKMVLVDKETAQRLEKYF